MKKPTIVEVPEKMERYYGKGTMLHPDMDMVAEVVSAIPFGEVASIDSVCSKLSNTFGTDTTCPMRTGGAIKKLAESSTNGKAVEEIPFWRVIRTNKLLINSKHKELSAARLEGEGWNLNFLPKGDIQVLIKDEEIYRP